MGPTQASKRRRLSPSDDENSSAAPKPKTASSTIQKKFYSRAAEWDLEQDYEQRPRKGKNKKDKEKTRLPIKTAQGVVHVEEPEEAAAASDSDSFLDTDSEDEKSKDGNDEDKEEEESEALPKVPLKIQIVQAKEEMARIATLINEDPEEHIGQFKKLAELVDKNTSHVAIKKLALATQAAIFRDVIPGYRIRPLGDEVNKTEKISKEVRQLRSYEQSLLSSYKHYVQQLSTLSRGSNKSTDSIRTVAINCACNMLLAVPHFNFRAELLKILVNRLSKRRIDANFIKSRETMEDIFAKDDDGIVSLEAVSLLSKMMKARNFYVHETTLNTFLHLRLLAEFSSKGSRDRIDRNDDDEQDGRRKHKNKKEFRTKKERKLLKDRKAVEKDMREADALVSNEAREKNQAETLKLVFGTYFRILKLRADTKLMGAVLEGLAKYAHLINQDFFGDLLEALKELIAQLEVQDIAEGDEKGNDQDDNYNEEEADEEEGLLISRQSTRQILLCTITAFALLEGQDASKAASSLHLDLSFFITHLYRALYPLSLNTDIEYNPDKSLRLPDPGHHDRADYKNSDNIDQLKRRNKVNFQTPMVLLLRCLQSTLLARTHGIAPPIRLAGFTKRLMTTSLQLPEKSSIAMLALLSKVAKQHARKIAPLWNTDERKGDGVFNPTAADVEKSNVFAGTVWEGELLRLHYCPEVREAAAGIDKLITSM